MNTFKEVLLFFKPELVLISTRNATSCNNHDDLLHLSFILQNSVFLRDLFRIQLNILEGAFVRE